MSRSKNRSRRRFRVRDLKSPLSLKSSKCDDSKALKKMQFAVRKNATWGTTSKRLHKNHRIWERYLGKARRRVDKVVIDAELTEVEERT